MGNQFAPAEKFPGDLIESGEWNEAMTEIERLEDDKVNRTGADSMSGPLTVDGHVRIAFGDLAIGKPGANSHRAGKIKLWGRPDDVAVHSIGTEAYHNVYGADESYTDSIGHKFYRGGGELIAQIGSGGSGTPDDRLNSFFAGDVQIAFGNLAIGKPGANSHRAGKIKLWGRPDDVAVHSIGTEAYHNVYGADESYTDSIGHKFYRGGGELIAQIGSGGSGTPDDRLNSFFAGDVQIGESDTSRRLTIYGPDLTGSQDGGLVVRRANYSSDYYLSLDNNMIDCRGGELYLNYYSKERVRVGGSSGAGMYVYGDLHATGDITAGGSIGCYITDRFVNQSGDALERGDVVVLGARPTKLFYGVDDNIPVPEVDLTTNAYDRRVCGIVAQILVEDAPTAPPAGGQVTPDDGVKRLQIFSAEEQEALDKMKVEVGQIGKMVTRGCFAHCKVDADLAPIETGDLLTTSPTEGHAQKVLEPAKAVGAIIGKALAPLDSGKGKIPVLVMLQ